MTQIHSKIYADAIVLSADSNSAIVNVLYCDSNSAIVNKELI